MTKDTNLELATALKEARQAKRLSMREAAPLFSVTHAAYNRWELGDSIPAFTSELLDQMTAFLGITSERMEHLVVQSIVAWNARRATR